MNIKTTLLSLLLISLSSTLWANTEVDASAGLAYNSNIYRTPTNDYVDFFADTTGGTIVKPIIQSGFFIPLSADITYKKRLAKKWRLIADYDFNSHLYLDKKFSNANQYRHRGTLGAKYKIHNFKKRKSSIYTGFILGDQKRDYYDRDTGRNKVVGTEVEDISDLYNFSTTGLEIEYEYWRRLDWSLKLALRMEQRDYSAATARSEQDHSFTRFSVDYNYRFNRVFRLAFDYSYTVQDFDNRNSRNIHGQLFSHHPELEYHFHRIGFAIIQRVNRDLRFRYGYELTTRDDKFVGYNDYTQNEFFASVRYRPTDKITLRASAIVRDIDFPNAWNFERDPALFPAITDTSHKSATNTNLVTSIEYTLNKKVSLIGSIAYRNNQNTDARYHYDRTIFTVGAKINLL